MIFYFLSVRDHGASVRLKDCKEENIRYSYRGVVRGGGWHLRAARRRISGTVRGVVRRGH